MDDFLLQSRWSRISSQKKIWIIFSSIIFFRILFALNVDLIDDEAYHWSWTKDLMLSYFDHPGMIAWLNWMSTRIFGDTILGVRFPSFICYSFVVIMIWKLAKDLFSVWVANFTALMVLWTPLWGFGGYVASPEPPFILCWVLAAWVFWQGVREDKNRWSPQKTWILLGILMGLGLNSKFIIALLAPGFAIYLLLTPQRKQLATPWPWIGIAIATLIAMPIFIWNFDYDWPGFRYQFHDRHTGEGFSVQRWFGWLGAQLLLVGPGLYILILLAFLVSFRRWQNPSWRFLCCLSLPSIFIFYPQPLWADYKPHWSGPAYMLLTIGAGALAQQGWKLRYWQIINSKSKKILGLQIGFLILFNILIYPPFAYPFWPKIYRIIKPDQTWNPRWDLSNEFFGWKEFGDYINRRQREVHAQSGHKPFIGALRYETTAQTYWGTGQKTYMLSRTVSHYSVIHQKHYEWDLLKGSDALVITTEKYQEKPQEFAQFDDCQPEDYKTYRHSEESRHFTLWICRNFQGVIK